MVPWIAEMLPKSVTTDQTGPKPRLIRNFAGAEVISLDSSCAGTKSSLIKYKSKRPFKIERKKVICFNQICFNSKISLVTLNELTMKARERQSIQRLI